MPKPTLLQSILGRPSQSYQHPAHRDYHSNRDDLFRIAHATLAIPGQYDDSGFDSSTPPNSDSEARLSSLTLDRPKHRPSSAFSRVSDADAPGSDSSQSRRPNNRPPIHSIASSSSFVSFKNVDADRPPTYRIPSSNTSPRQSRSSRDPSTRGNEGDIEDNSSGDDDNTTDVFYTPRSSIVSSPRTSRTPATMLEPQALASALLPLHTSSLQTRNPLDDDSASVSRTPSDTSLSSAASSTSGGDDSPSLFSSPTTSTRPTTAVGSERGSKPDAVEAVTIASSSRPRTLSTGAKSAGSSSSARSSTVRKQAPEQPRKLTYTDEDWARDVKWLGPPRMPAASSPGSARRHSRTLPSDFQMSVPSTDARTARRPGHPRSKGDRRSKRSRNSRGRMSALWEEDESEDGSTGVSSTDPSRSSTPIPETPPHSLPTSPLTKTTPLPTQNDHQDDNTPSESTHSESTPDARLERYAKGQRRNLSSASSLFRPGASSNAHVPTFRLPEPLVSSSTTHANGYTGLTFAQTTRAPTGKLSMDGHVDLVRAGVAQTSMVTIEVIRGAASASQNPAPVSGSPSKGRRPSFSFSLGRSFSLTLKSKKRESATPVHLQGSLPLPVAFTAHVAPPSYVPESHVLVQVHAVGLDSLDSLIVHEKAGMNGGGFGGGKGVGGGKAGFIPGRSFVGKVVECGWAVREEVCKRNEWVIGLLDVKKCGALAEFILVERHRVHRVPQPRARNAAIFPPRRRVHLRSSSMPANGHGYSHSPLAPTALTIEELALLPLCGVPAHRAIRTFADVLAPPLTSKSSEHAKTPDVRALVLRAHDGAGALAVQMLGRRGIRLCVQVPESSMFDGSEDLPKDPRKLSLNSVSHPSPSKSDKGKSKEGQKPTLSKRAQLEMRLRAAGVEDICVGEPLDVLRQLAEEGQSFDMVLDTVGGAAIWEASQRLLTMDWTVAASRSSLSLGGSRSNSIDLTRDQAAPSEAPGSEAAPTKPSKTKSTISHAQFTTLVGDAPHRPIPTAQDNLRSGLRSLRRSMSTSGTGAGTNAAPAPSANVLTRGGNKSQKRVVGYAWVSVAADVDYEGEDVRDSLAAIVRMAEAGIVRPLCLSADGEPVEDGKVVPFERAPEVFRRGVAGPLGVLADGGTCAIRIVG